MTDKGETCSGMLKKKKKACEISESFGHKHKLVQVIFKFTSRAPEVSQEPLPCSSSSPLAKLLLLSSSSGSLTLGGRGNLGKKDPVGRETRR